MEFQCAIADFVGGLEINLPSDKLLANIPFPQIRLAEKVSPTLITGVRTVFLDGSRKTGRAAIAWQEGKNWKHFVSSGHSSTQRVELFAAIMALWQWPQEPLNIVSDSGYTLYTILHLDQALIKTSIDPNLLTLFLTLQSLLDGQEHPLFITHIRSHSGMPGPLVDSNNRADALVKCPSCLPASSSFSSVFSSEQPGAPKVI